MLKPFQTFWHSPQRCCMLFVCMIILRYLMYVEVVEISSFKRVFHFNCLLMIWRDRTDICTFIMCPETLQMGILTMYWRILLDNLCNLNHRLWIRSILFCAFWPYIFYVIFLSYCDWWKPAKNRYSEMFLAHWAPKSGGMISTYPWVRDFL